MEIGGHDSKIYAQENLTPCSNCSRRFPPDTLQLHETYCIRNFRKCDICGSMIDKSTIEEHKKEMHSLKKCLHCSQSYAGRQFDLHMQNCMLLPVVCNYCKKSFPKVNLQGHKLSCGDRVKQCNICKKKVPLKQLQGHQIRCQNRHQIRRENSQEPQFDRKQQIFRQNSQNHINLQAQRKHSSKEINKKNNQFLSTNCIRPEQIKQQISTIPISIQITLREKQAKQRLKKYEK